MESDVLHFIEEYINTIKGEESRANKKLGDLYQERDRLDIELKKASAAIVTLEAFIEEAFSG